jgi:hypothetical protein
MKKRRTSSQSKRFFVLRMKNLFFTFPRPRERRLLNGPLFGEADEIDLLDLQLFEYLLGHI